MKSGFRSFEERLESNGLEQQDRVVMDVLREVDQGVQGSFDDYAVVNFTDSSGRFAEIRVRRDADDAGAYTLNANVGSVQTMVELFERMRDSGIRISRMASIHASKEENERLKAMIAAEE